MIRFVFSTITAIIVFATIACAGTAPADSVAAAPVVKTECQNPQYGGWIPTTKPEQVVFSLNGVVVNTEKMVVVRDVTCPVPADSVKAKK